ncbi:MAG: alanyl-tRNA editing protein [Candidatus Thorarchaeota archaeon SMTZ1-45]|nr:MAG: hypothetical protein AM325_10885 [Candidatus Thorarchaeota archaeon SMTZ1-45]
MSEIPPYWIDPKKNQFKVTITSAKKYEDSYHVRIGEDVIRPAGGGQAGDRGQLIVDNQRVQISDTISDSKGSVLITDNELVEGATGILEIDMDWRLSMMKNHTAEHLFVSVIKNKIEDIAVGNLWIDGEHGSVELLKSKLSLDLIYATEQEVLEIIDQDIPVTSKFVASTCIDPSTRKREGLEEKHDMLRVVNIGEMDSTACSGIHVTRTGEIGFLKVIDVKMNEKATQIEFLTGSRAAVHVSEVYNTVLRRKYSYPFEIEQLGAVLDRAKQAVEDRQKLIDKVNHLLSSGPTIEQIGKVSFRHEYLSGYDASSLKILANQLSTDEQSIILLFNLGKKSQVILRANGMPLEASDYIKGQVIKLGGKGGGRGDVYTGGFVDVEDPMNLYNTIVSEVRKLIS